MALIGFEIITQYKQWRRTQHPIAYRQLRILVSIVLAQSCVDLMIEQVSFSGHLTGLIWGGLLGLVHSYIKSGSLRYDQAHRGS
jgi:membrane associated rhomboid family serine protease